THRAEPAEIAARRADARSGAGPAARGRRAAAAIRNSAAATTTAGDGRFAAATRVAARTRATSGSAAALFRTLCERWPRHERGSGEHDAECEIANLHKRPSAREDLAVRLMILQQICHRFSTLFAGFRPRPGCACPPRRSGPYYLIDSGFCLMFQATTVLAVRHNGQSVMASDGQVTFGETVVKQRARKIRRLYNDRILAGFAGSAADSFALFARFEAKLEQYRGNLERSAVELAKDWRIDRALRRLEAMLV